MQARRPLKYSPAPVRRQARRRQARPRELFEAPVLGGPEADAHRAHPELIIRSLFMHPTMPPRRSALSFAAASLALIALAACDDGPLAPQTKNVAGSADSRVVADAAEATGAVYTLTNAADGNGVIAFRRAADGALTAIGTFAAGGRGTGGTVDPLASQYALVLSGDHDALFAVDAGSDQLSSFRANADGSLALATTVGSGGERPVSLAVHGGLLYALNAGDNTVSGFRVTGGARLVSLPGTTHALAAGASGASTVRFTPDGRYLVVSERVSNRLEVFPVQPSGRLGDPVVTPGHGGVSFGFDITSRNQPIVSEAQGSLTSYALATGGALNAVTGSISTGGNAPCWVIITSDGRFAYVTNSASDFVAGFAVAADGGVTALTPGVPTGPAGAGATPI